MEWRSAPRDARLAKSNIAPLRAIGTLDRLPPRWFAVTLGVGPFRNHVTMRVASVASVGAMSSPTSALTSVDLPAFSVPASAMRMGWLRLPADALQLVVHVGALAVRRIGPVGLNGAAQDRAHLIARAHIRRASLFTGSKGRWRG